MPGAAGERTGGSLLPNAAAERFRARADAAASRALRTGEATIASVTEPIGIPLDPAAVVVGARQPGEEWGIIEQPDNGGSSICALGRAVELKGSGEQRFAGTSAEWARLARGAIADALDGAPPGSGPIVLGGFSFDGRDRTAGPWRGFGGGSLVVPAISFTRKDGDLRISLQLLVEPGTDHRAAVDALIERVEGMDPDCTLPAGVPRSVEGASVASSLPPEHYEAAVRHALDAIDERRIEKVVLAREVIVEAGVEVDAGAVLDELRQRFPSCFVFAVGRGDAVFLGASPELLIRREGLHASTVALAGSAARSADAAANDHLGERLMNSGKDRAEQGIVADSIAATLRPVSVWVSASPEPQLVSVANIQHLGTPIRARLREPVATVELVGMLHPTPAVGAQPWPEGSAVMSECEGLDRGWYAAPIGWSDSAGNGEFLVALRCALLRGSEARCFAGVGVVAGSVPELEFAETELKLQAMLPILLG